MRSGTPTSSRVRAVGGAGPGAGPAAAHAPGTAGGGDTPGRAVSATRLRVPMGSTRAGAPPLPPSSAAAGSTVSDGAPSASTGSSSASLPPTHSSIPHLTDHRRRSLLMYTPPLDLEGLGGAGAGAGDSGRLSSAAPATAVGSPREGDGPGPEGSPTGGDAGAGAGVVVDDDFVARLASGEAISPASSGRSVVDGPPPPGGDAGRGVKVRKTQLCTHGLPTGPYNPSPSSFSHRTRCLAHDDPHCRPREPQRV